MCKGWKRNTNNKQRLLFVFFISLCICHVFWSGHGATFSIQFGMFQLSNWDRYGGTITAPHVIRYFPYVCKATTHTNNPRSCYVATCGPSTLLLARRICTLTSPYARSHAKYIRFRLIRFCVCAQFFFLFVSLTSPLLQFWLVTGMWNTYIWAQRCVYAVVVDAPWRYWMKWLLVNIRLCQTLASPMACQPIPFAPICKNIAILGSFRTRYDNIVWLDMAGSYLVCFCFCCEHLISLAEHNKNYLNTFIHHQSTNVPTMAKYCVCACNMDIDWLDRWF